MTQSRALWYTGAGRVELRDVNVPAPGEGEVLVKASFSGISRGTERLIYQGNVPSSQHGRMRCPHQDGEFPFPVKYGYAMAGEVVEGSSEVLGRSVFVLHPHQEVARVKISELHEIPDNVPFRRAVLAANTETAVNVLWDANPLPGERILIIGGGVLGLLVASLAAQPAQNDVTVVDIDLTRGEAAQRLGVKFATPENAPTENSVVIHTSASEGGLRKALLCAANDGRIIEASWYGNQEISIPLGEAFHSRRLRIISSQVGAIPPSHRKQWTPRQRIQKALNILQDAKFDALVTGEIDFSAAPTMLPGVLANDSSGLMTAIRYP